MTAPDIQALRRAFHAAADAFCDELEQKPAQRAGQHARRARRVKGSPRQLLQPTETDQAAARVIALRELAKVRA